MLGSFFSIAICLGLNPFNADTGICFFKMQMSVF